jgi:hypothetical protein
MLLPSLEAEEFLAQRIFVFRLWFLDNLAYLFLLETCLPPPARRIRTPAPSARGIRADLLSWRRSQNSAPSSSMVCRNNRPDA